MGKVKNNRAGSKGSRAVDTIILFLGSVRLDETRPPPVGRVFRWTCRTKKTWLSGSFPTAESDHGARFDFLPGPGMRAHLRQIVNTFIHVKAAASIVFCSPLDNETGAFWSFSRRRRRRIGTCRSHTETILIELLENLSRRRRFNVHWKRDSSFILLLARSLVLPIHPELSILTSFLPTIDILEMRNRGKESRTMTVYETQMNYVWKVCLRDVKFLQYRSAHIFSRFILGQFWYSLLIWIEMPVKSILLKIMFELVITIWCLPIKT